MKRIHEVALVAGLVACMMAASRPARAGSRLGDAGHFLQFPPDIYANNPAGKAFAVTVHRHVWPTKWGNQGDYKTRVLDPAGKEVARGRIPSGQAKVTMNVPAGAKGVYRIVYEGAGYSLTWIECTLDQMVAGCGDWDMKDGPFRTFMLHVMAPRRWYFFVPYGTKRFQVKHTIMPFQSHREDYGFLVMNPRGQRVAAFYGGKPLEVETKKPNVPIPIVQSVEPDPGTTGRFWSIWATGGDSHNFSDLQILVKGVPPYYAPTPEQWFDPRTGKAPEKLLYDESEIRTRDKHGKRDAAGRLLSRDHYLLTPAPFLGDDDYNGMRGPHTIFMANPDNRAVDFGVCSYIIPEGRRMPVTFTVFGPDGKRRLDHSATFAHQDSARLTMPRAGGGVYRVDVDAGQWYAWNEPATPIVLAGHKAGKDGAVFRLEVGVARHWFFRVPKGTKGFGVKVSVKDPAHVLRAEVHAPDRIADVMYVRGGRPREVNVGVPAGLDGRVWFLRLAVGSATRFVSEDVEKPKHVRIDADVELHGVPGYLAPTWEQWFDPGLKR